MQIETGGWGGEEGLVKSAADKAKTLRGAGMSVVSFACTVATFV